MGFESDPEAKIAKMKDGTTHLAYKPGHAVDLDTGAVVAAELHPADEGDTTTLSKTLAKAEANLEAVDAAPTSEDPAECVADKGYHSRAVLRALNDSPWKTRIAAPKQTGFSRWHGDEAARRAVTNNRARLKSGVAREAFKLRAEIVERCFAHNLDRGGMRRTWLRGRENVHKRYLLHVAGHNLSLLMRQLIGAGTPREAVAGGYGGIFVLLTPTGAMLVARGVSQSGQTAFAAAFLIWGESRKKPLNQRAVKGCAEEKHEPTLDPETLEFTCGFGLDEAHPRGQFNAQAAMAEAMTEGAWWRLFNEPNLRKFIDPTVYGVDFPTVRLSQAIYDEARRKLVIATDAGVPKAAGEPTTFRITNVRAENCRVEVDGEVSDAWRAVEGDIEISTTVGEHTFVLRMN